MTHLQQHRHVRRQALSVYRVRPNLLRQFGDALTCRLSNGVIIRVAHL